MKVATELDILSLFVTVIALFDVPDAVSLNAQLRRVIEQRERTHPAGRVRSNLGGWQSSDDMETWGGTAAIKLLAFARNVANRMTTDREGNPGRGPHPEHFAVTWRANLWANINRKGEGNAFHSHPGAFWSGVYYVDDGGIDADPSLGGELEFMDPRGPLPLMLAPHLGYVGSSDLSNTSIQALRPKPGRLVMFPAWLMHQVRPYHGTAERISVAFNLTP
jgi:uncharacterized protein (TIGR02466 family)